mgnify:CR=1 FL=1
MMIMLCGEVHHFFVWSLPQHTWGISWSCAPTLGPRFWTQGHIKIFHIHVSSLHCPWQLYRWKKMYKMISPESEANGHHWFVLQKHMEGSIHHTIDWTAWTCKYHLMATGGRMAFIFDTNLKVSSASTWCEMSLAATRSGWNRRRAFL